MDDLVDTTVMDLTGAISNLQQSQVLGQVQIAGRVGIEAPAGRCCVAGASGGIEIAVCSMS